MTTITDLIFYLNNGDRSGFRLGTHEIVRKKLKHLAFTTKLREATAVLLPWDARAPSKRVQEVFPNPKSWFWEDQVADVARLGAYDWQIVSVGNKRQIYVPPALRPPSDLPPEVLTRIHGFDASIATEENLRRVQERLRSRRQSRRHQPSAGNGRSWWRKDQQVNWGSPFALTDPMALAESDKSIEAQSDPGFYSGGERRVQVDTPIEAPKPAVIQDYKPLPLPSDAELASAKTPAEITLVQEKLFQNWRLQAKPMFVIIGKANYHLTSWETETTPPSAFGPFVALVEEALDTMISMMELGFIFKIFLEKHNPKNSFSMFANGQVEPDVPDVFIQTVERTFWTGHFDDTIELLKKLNDHLLNNVNQFISIYKNMKQKIAQDYKNSKGTLKCAEKSKVCAQNQAAYLAHPLIYTIVDLQKLICNRMNTVKKAGQRAFIGKRATYDLISVGINDHERHMRSITDSINFILEQLDKPQVTLNNREDFCQALDETTSLTLEIFKRDYLNLFNKHSLKQPIGGFMVWLMGRVPEIKEILRLHMFPYLESNQYPPMSTFEVYNMLRTNLNKVSDKVLIAIGVFFVCTAFHMMLFLNICTYADINEMFNLDESVAKDVEAATNVSVVDNHYLVLNDAQAANRNFENRASVFEKLASDPVNTENEPGLMQNMIQGARGLFNRFWG